jgi:hypothetical protein
MRPGWQRRAAAAGADRVVRAETSLMAWMHELCWFDAMF